MASGSVARGDSRIEEERLGNRARVGEARRLDHHLIERDFPGLALCEVRQRRAQIVADAAAQAPVAELDDLFVAARDDDLAVDVLLTELVLGLVRPSPVNCLKFRVRRPSSIADWKASPW
jgi:hypothetical protein